MRHLFRWVRRGLLALVALVLVAGGVVYALSERIMHRTYREPLVAIAVPVDPGAIAEGQRLAQLRGCSGGCHGTEIEGSVFMDTPLLGKVIAPNLSVAVRHYSDAELAGIVRRGVRPDGRSVVVMPSEMFSGLSDGDLGKILAYLHSVPPRPGPGRGVRLGPLARLGLVLDKYQTSAQLVRRADSLVSAYPAPGDSTEAFTRLLRTGKALGDRELDLMSYVARRRFTHFTDAEIQALRGFLLARATRSD